MAMLLVALPLVLLPPTRLMVPLVLLVLLDDVVLPTLTLLLLELLDDVVVLPDVLLLALLPIPLLLVLLPLPLDDPFGLALVPRWVCEHSLNTADLHTHTHKRFQKDNNITHTLRYVTLDKNVLKRLSQGPSYGLALTSRYFLFDATVFS